MLDHKSYHHQFKEYLFHSFDVKATSWQILQPLLTIKSLPKNTAIVKEKQKYNNEIFLVKGIVRLYYLGLNGEEINIAFYKGADTIRPLFTRHVNGTHSCFIETISNAVYIEFDAEKFNHLIRNYNDIQHYAYQIVERELKYNIEREKQQLSQNAQERLKAFRANYKGLENEIPHYHIASFLGISPVSLSRLRKQTI